MCPISQFSSFFPLSGKFCFLWEQNRHFSGGPRFLAEMGKEGRAGLRCDSWQGKLDFYGAKRFSCAVKCLTGDVVFVHL